MTIQDKELLQQDHTDFIIDALNCYWHNQNKALENPIAGDIERSNWEGIKAKAKFLMDHPDLYSSKQFEIWQQEYQARQAEVVDKLHKELLAKDQQRENDIKRIEDLKRLLTATVYIIETMTDKELLEQCKDEASKERGYTGWGDPKMGLSASLKVMNQVADLYASKLREADKKRIEELEQWIASDSVYTLLRYGSKSPSSSGVDDCDDDHYYDLYNLSIELRAKKQSP